MALTVKQLSIDEGPLAEVLIAILEETAHSMGPPA
jgi:hypothetical protein